jgi:regulator of protease activity HflC (stomatin/prohibitin superfamily)
MDVLIKETHRGLYYEDGVLKQVLEAGRYTLPLGRTDDRPGFWARLIGSASTPAPTCEVVTVDLRARDLTIKGQEILTSDKVAIRVSILVQFRVTDPKMAVHAVENYEDRLYSDVQLAARRALAAMTLEEILTSRHRLSEEILREVQEAARGYGVAITRADVKDLVFPGNLQEVMNRVLTAERLSEAQRVEARTRAEVQQLEAQTQASIQVAKAQAQAEATRIAAQADAEALSERVQNAAAYATHPALLRLEELAALRALAGNANARLYLDFMGPKNLPVGDPES